MATKEGSTWWVVLEEANERGRRFLRLPKTIGSADYQSHAVTVGPTVRVRWPDGSITIENVVWNTFSEHVCEHGHYRHVTSKLPSVQVNINICGYSSTHRIPISELAVDIDFLKDTL